MFEAQLKIMNFASKLLHCWMQFTGSKSINDLTMHFLSISYIVQYMNNNEFHIYPTLIPYISPKNVRLNVVPISIAG